MFSLSDLWYDIVGYSLIPVLASCRVKAEFQFTSGCGAVLAIDNNTICSIDPPNFLRRLLNEDKLQIASSTSKSIRVSFLHMLGTFTPLESPRSKTITISLGEEPSESVSGIASVMANLKLASSANASNFKSKVIRKSKDLANEYTSTIRLVSLKEKNTSVGLRGPWDGDTHRSVVVVNARLGPSVPRAVTVAAVSHSSHVSIV